jgi:uncharacterized protein YjiS (DUF1127 family)
MAHGNGVAVGPLRRHGANEAPAQLKGETLLGRYLFTLETWRRRYRARRALGALDDSLLRDIGLTRSKADRESAKPFWR